VTDPARQDNKEEGMGENPSLLAGLRVLDQGSHVSSALASMVLADFGAEVTTLAAPEVQSHPAAPMLMRGKRVLQAAACSEYEQALAEADILITTLGPDDAQPAPHATRIHLNISGWGLQGPYACYPMVEALVAAKSGRMMAFENMNPREGPAYAALQVASFAAAVIGVQGVIAALMQRDATGRGQRVDTSLLHALMNYDTIGIQRAQLEPRYPQYLPPEPLSAKMQRVNYQPVQGRDGNWIQQGNLLDRLFQSFLKITGLKELVPEADRKTDNQHWPKDTAEMMRAAIMRRVRERDAADWLAEFKADGNVAAAPYQTTQQALDDPDLVVSKAVTDFDHPTLGKVRWLGPIAHMEATPARIGAGPSAAAVKYVPATPKQAAGKPDRAPLAGVTVLEFASIIATPLAMSGLSDLGARVIKIEPIGGDPGRRCDGNMGVGVSSLKLNAGKESICLELKSAKGREILDRLLPKGDIIAHNFRPGVPDKLGFGYERAKTFNPKVVWISANGYGT
jgi:crotonobetainyl-CoA:carnitine CoA-transferase CaiB-like acyl-CoA transferase